MAQPPEDLRCQNNRDRIAELQKGVDEIAAHWPFGRMSADAARLWCERNRTDTKVSLANARLGRISRADQEIANRRSFAGELGVAWRPAFDEDFPAYFSAILEELNKEALVLDSLDKLAQEITMRRNRLKELGCRDVFSPTVEGLPADVDTPKRTPAGGLKSKVTTKPSRQDGGWSYNYGATSSTMTYSSTGGRVSVTATFTGVPAALTPGSDFTVTISGSFSSNPKNAGDNVRVTAWVECSGLEMVSQQTASMSPRGVSDGKYVFHVPANVQSAELRLMGDFGLGETAVHRYSR